MKLPIPPILQKITDMLAAKGAKAVVVGGAVRDSLLGLECKDWDIEVYNIDNQDELKSYLEVFGVVNSVGKSFGVLKLKSGNSEFDFALPRLEKKVAKGHTGFTVRVDSKLEFVDATKRRDFTINAIGYDIAEKKIVDPYGGIADLKKRILRAVDSDTFIEDPLRIYRAVGFAARFNLTLEHKTAQLCKEMIKEQMLEEISRERIWEEWKKFLLKAKKPSRAFELMHQFGMIKHYFEELELLIGLEQDPLFHPEGDVWTHTMLTIDAMQNIIKQEQIEDEKLKLRLMLAALTHDLGKVVTTKTVDGKIRSPGHCKAGVEPTRSLLYKLTNEHKFIDSVLPLVEHHMKPAQLFFGGAKAAAIRRLAKKVTIKELVLVAKADFLGRDTNDAKEGFFEAGEWLLQKAKELQVESKALDNIITGKDLIALGFTPSERFKVILEDVYNKFTEDDLQSKAAALEYVLLKYGRE